MTDCEAVKLWRDTFRLNLSASWKKDVEITVKDLKLWAEIIAGWGYRDAKGKWHRKAPGIKNLLTEYERLEADKRDNEAVTVSPRDRARVSERGNRYVSQVRSEAECLYFGGGEVDARRLR